VPLLLIESEDGSGDDFWSEFLNWHLVLREVNRSFREVSLLNTSN
jgi:hypothetical protein